MTISEQILHPGGSETVAVIEPMGVVTITPVPEPVVEIAPAAPVEVPAAPPAVENIPLLPEPPEPHVLIRAWDWTTAATRALNGLRTLLFFGVTGALAFGAKLTDVDLSGTISRLVGGRVDAADIAIFMSVGGIVLRFLTTTQVFARWRKAAQGDKLPAASAAVDEPDEEGN